MKPPLTTRWSKSNCAIVTGVALLTIGIILTFSKKFALEIILPSFVLQPNSVIEEFWRKPPMDIPTNTYFFNWTNTEDINNSSIKPKFEEVGPYRFKQNMNKVNITWNDNSTVTYRQLRFLNFDEEGRNGNLSDTVSTLNVFAWAVAKKIRNWNYFMRTAASGLLALSSKPYVTRTIKQIIYEGFDDMGNELFGYLQFLTPEVPRFEKFGVLSYNNGTAKGFEEILNVNNGINGSYDVRYWNYRNETPYFTKYCAKITGSTGELHSPRHSRDEDLKVFLIDVCREMILEYEGDVVIDGTLGYKYSVGKKLLDNGTLIPGNECYCNGECLPSGMLNVSSCKYGFSLHLSLPHFYGADPYYVHLLKGVQPEKNRHESYVIVEPNTGIPLKAVLRIQVNTRLEPVENIEMFKNVPDVMFPLFWMDVEITLPNNFMDMLKMILIVPYIYSAAANVLITMGIFLLSAGIICRPWCFVLYRKVCRKEKSISLKPEIVPLQNNEIVRE